jgi:hypothetical protein
MIAAIRRVLAVGMAKHTSVPEERRAMQSAAASWAIYGAVKEWLHMADRPPVDAIVPDIVRMVTPLLGSPLQGSPLAEHQASEHQASEHQAAELTTPAR